MSVVGHKRLNCSTIWALEVQSSGKIDADIIHEVMALKVMNPLVILEFYYE